MCGIAGGFSRQSIRSTVLQQATDTLRHRGPDAGGYFTDDAGHVFVGHRRLSILDLSDSANQPMHSACGRYVMVYNGEVYNFRELKKKLPAHHWHTHSDTEVILELFVQFGAACFEWLNGMFAIAIYDQQTATLFLSRDHIGIKPLYYFQDSDTFFFASELKSVRRYATEAGKTLTTNKAAIPSFLHLGFIPEPQSIYEQVYKFPAGRYGVLTTADGRFKTHSFWNAADCYLHDPIADEPRASKLYEETLFQAVEDQMVSDVPLGTFLSGGIDSSLVTAAASKIASQKVQTFSIGFHEAKYDETTYAASVAKHLKTNHHIFKVSVNDVLELIPDLLQVYDEPFADSSAFPTMLVSRLARQHVTVVLSGDGGDELFQGYGMYTWANRLNNPFFKTFRKPVYALTQLMGNRVKRGGSLFNYPSAQRLHTHIFSQEQYFFSEHELSRLLTDTSFSFAAMNKLDIPTGKGNAAEQQAFWDLQHYLKDDLLVKVDRASMQYSLETRVPLLDNRLVALALRLDYNLKVSKEYGTKHLMKKLLYEMVPQQVFERPKQGFAIPLKEWLRGPLEYLIDDYLSEATIRSFSIVRFEEVSSLIARFRAGEDFLYNRIWLLIVLHWWLQSENKQ